MLTKCNKLLTKTRSHHSILLASFIILSPLILLFLISYVKLALPIVNSDLTSIIKLLVIAPILEEVVFRGLLQDFIKKITVSKLTCYFIVNIIFALLHYKNSYDILYLSGVFISGLIFSTIKDYYKKISVAIICHAYFNLIYLIITQYSN
ncbi:JDVT-CTERM system glutamic-type intramembrane protease [Aquella oligotrophica]|uniref:CAAX prenyl protease 2/Lysostaphin resistance protein A-like domain-containing protein n=1 Tax=Aquella oligotrophica TaxID=2067065 RepID=A0A2I7N7P9_9NEIS|nr:hypothetical protein CUN60_09310 [Aquella oligotrophica]